MTALKPFSTQQFAGQSIRHCSHRLGRGVFDPPKIGGQSNVRTSGETSVRSLTLPYWEGNPPLNPNVRVIHEWLTQQIAGQCNSTVCRGRSGSVSDPAESVGNPTQAAVETGLCLSLTQPNSLGNPTPTRIPSAPLQSLTQTNSLGNPTDASIAACFASLIHHRKIHRNRH